MAHGAKCVDGERPKIKRLMNIPKREIAPNGIEEPWRIPRARYIAYREEHPMFPGLFETVQIHRESVQEAIAIGKTIPTEVLRDYPEFKK